MNPKIEPPEKGTRADEANRMALDAAVAGVPVIGGATAILVRHVFPSKRDKKTEAWHAQVSDTVNDHETRLNLHECQATIARREVEDVQMEVSSLSVRIEEMAVATQQASVAVDAYDAGLEMCRVLIEQGRHRTAFDLLSVRLDNREEVRDDALTARILSALGACKLRLGDVSAAARLFLDAYARCAEPAKVRQNAAVAHHIEGRDREAMALLEELLADDPHNAALWANIMIVRDTLNYPTDPFEGVPLQVQRDESVLSVAVSILRERDGPGWHDLAEHAVRTHPDSPGARRAAAEAAIDRAVSIRTADKPEPQAMSKAIAVARDAAEVLAELWAAFAATEVDATAVDLSLLLNTITGFRLAEDSPVFSH